MARTITTQVKFVVVQMGRLALALRVPTFSATALVKQGSLAACESRYPTSYEDASFSRSNTSFERTRPPSSANR